MILPIAGVGIDPNESPPFVKTADPTEFSSFITVSASSFGSTATITESSVSVIVSVFSNAINLLKNVIVIFPSTKDITKNSVGQVGFCPHTEWIL